MDILRRPPAISEDTLQYTIQPGPAFSDRSAVTALATVIHSHASSRLPNHIWHRDAFELKVVKQSLKHDKWTIEGHMRVGDCVDDEWCVVWLLRDVTQYWDVAVSVSDSDGDFLLIEAAEHLPAWVTPSNSENRVWIYEGHLHLVPLQFFSSSTAKPELRRPPATHDEAGDKRENNSDHIAVLDAVSLVRDPKINTATTSDIERVAFRRTDGYPSLARQHLHRTKALIPQDIAFALSGHPSLVQKAIEAFYTRDTYQLRDATRMVRFTPSSSILAIVTMTRTAYAQLMGQRFPPPKPFGQWKENEGTHEWRWKDIGMKIACGFEMLYQETKSRHETTVDAHNEALQRDPEYIKYIQNLQRTGFFKEEVEGSVLWSEQESRAAAQFIHAKQMDNANRTSFASLVNSAILEAQTKVESIYVSDHEDEDSDEWLLVDERMMDSMLSNSFRPETSPVTILERRRSGMDVDKEDHKELREDNIAVSSDLHNLANKVEQFVDGQGDVEGARFQDELFSDESNASGMSDSEDDNSLGSRNSDTHVASAERQIAMDKLIPGLEPSEYGAMPPSFHCNSQILKEVSTESQIAPVELARQKMFSESKPVRPLVFSRDQFDGVEDSDDESEDERDDSEEDEEDRPEIVGEVEIDMQEEEEDFLKFSREALGISPEMWNDIVQDRKERGAFLPHSALREELAEDNQMSSSSNNPADSRLQTFNSRVANRNPNLDSFDTVMQAMDAELCRVKQEKQAANTQTAHFMLPTNSKSKNKGKQKMGDVDDDVGAEMDAELRAALQGSSDDEGDETTMDYTLMKNFLESFKSQQGLPGPVGNLAGRLGWQLPRDES